eukprot:Em0003g1882a
MDMLVVVLATQLNSMLAMGPFYFALVLHHLVLSISKDESCQDLLSMHGHHAVTCKRGGDAISRHNKLRDVVLQTCHRACIGAKAEAGSGLGHELRNTRPADILASNWLCGKPAAFDLTVVSPLNPTFISEVGRTAGSAAVAAELRKHSANDAKCSELGWTCIPLVAESYGAWGSEAVQAFSRLASYLATRTNSPKSKVVCSLYGCLNLTLVRANARALLLRCGCSLQEGDISSS